MNIKPALTEKSMSAAREGKYTFWVPVDMGKFKIKEVINKAFGVHVTSVRTQKKSARKFLSLARREIGVKGTKKAIVTLRDKEKINLFEVDKKK